MAIPADPTINAIVTEAMKRAGRYTPSAAEVTSATEHQFRETKGDIVFWAGQHPILRTTAVSTLIPGKSRYALPSDYDVIESVVLLDSNANTGWTGTAQAGAAGSFTAAAALNEDAANIQGKFAVMTGGTGVDQYRQITAYNNVTKVVTVDSNWTVIPNGTTTYLIAAVHTLLWQQDKHQDWDHMLSPWQLGRPLKAALVASEVWLDYAPDIQYCILFTYYPHLDRLDEAGTVFLKALREWRTIWVQGVTVKTMQRYDDERYPGELSVYQVMLNALAARSSSIGQVMYQDV